MTVYSFYERFATSAPLLPLPQYGQAPMINASYLIIQFVDGDASVKRCCITAVFGDEVGVQLDGSELRETDLSTATRRRQQRRSVTGYQTVLLDDPPGAPADVTTRRKRTTVLGRELT